MAPTTDYGPPEGNAELRQYAEHVGQSFVIPPEDWLANLNRIGLRDVRLLRKKGRIEAGMCFYRMGQWFGGRSVPCWGVAAVVAPPGARSGGAGAKLMREVLLEAHSQGVALSALYPATQPVYRAAGYEIAGSRTGYRLPVEGIGLRERGAEVRPATEADRALYRRLYGQSARGQSGMLDRNDALWLRLEGSRENPAYHYVIEQDGEPQGYFIFTQKRATFPRADYTVLDHVTLTPLAARRMLAFFASHWSTGENLFLHGAPLEPLLLHLAEQKARVDTRWDWMLRLVDVPAALKARGYPAGARQSLHFSVRDEVLAANSGMWTLDVEGGEGRVRKGGKSHIELEARALAPLYSGALTPAALVRLGWMRAPRQDLEALTEVFASPSPWMMDFF